ncbi:hypothetical protein B0T14DRAFT_531617 [Immersiella caudata]|uniref:Uncharacterized protein n=1 Tax=Immersiella caudata TaxID=314043 RepID=A0AA39WBE2_9PEZI|nr:hypothetical protein B0T14DRAFT_531617 [Immersiella caudata]
MGYLVDMLMLSDIQLVAVWGFVRAAEWCTAPCLLHYSADDDQLRAGCHCSSAGFTTTQFKALGAMEMRRELETFG